MIKTKPFRCILLMVLVFPALVNSANWSRIIASQSSEDVTISFRQKLKNNGWLVEWLVQNDSDVSIEPILIKRHYICHDNSTLSLGEKTLGIYLPNSNIRGSVKDFGICPNSTIKLVEIKTEIHNVSDKIDPFTFF